MGEETRKGLKIFPINSSIHDSNVDKVVDSGSQKELDPELAPETALNFEEDDTESVEVTNGVEESSKEVNDKECLSPDTVLVVVRPSFKSTVEKE